VSPREDREQKAARLLASTQVTIRCGEDGIEAVVRGDHDSYRLHLGPSGWTCPCPYPRADCSHVRAVEAVTGWRR
jgi:hypothetical protein